MSGDIILAVPQGGAVVFTSSVQGPAGQGVGQTFGTDLAIINATNQAVIGWEQRALDAVTMGAPTNAQIPIWVNGSSVWKAISITGDYTFTAAGVGIVAKINGASVPAAGALVTGNSLGVTAASTLAYGPLNLAGGANYVTGVLPSANVASPVGDLNGTIGANHVDALTGTGSVVSIPASTNLTIARLHTGFTLSQAINTTDVASHDLTITGQASWASATGANIKGGDIILNVAAPSDGGVTHESAILFERGGTPVARLGCFNGEGATYGLLHLGAVAFTNTNFAMESNGASLYTNAASAIYGCIGGSSTQFTVLTNTAFEIGGNSSTYLWKFDFATAAAVLHYSPTCTSATIQYDQHASAGGNLMVIQGQSAAAGAFAGGYNDIRGGARGQAGQLKGGVRLQVNGTTETMCEVGEVVAGNRVVALCRAANLTSTQMPANTGDGVEFLGYATTSPTTGLPASGFIRWADSTGEFLKGPSGAIVQIGLP